MPRIAVFGSFDGLHKGHEHLLAEASQHGEVIVILAQDSVIRRLKKREPHFSFEARAEALQAHSAVHRVYPSDETEGAYLCIRELKPDLIGFGYDQYDLKQHFLAWREQEAFPVDVVTFAPFEPDRYKTSLLHKTSL